MKIVFPENAWSIRIAVRDCLSPKAELVQEIQFSKMFFFIIFENRAASLWLLFCSNLRRSICQKGNQWSRYSPVVSTRCIFCLKYNLEKYNFELVRYEDIQQQMHEVDNHQMHLNRIWEGVNISDFAQRNSLTHRVEEEVGMGGSSAIAGAGCKMVPIGCVACREKRQMLVFRQTLLWGEM